VGELIDSPFSRKYYLGGTISTFTLIFPYFLHLLSISIEIINGQPNYIKINFNNKGEANYTLYIVQARLVSIDGSDSIVNNVSDYDSIYVHAYMLCVCYTLCVCYMLCICYVLQHNVY